MKILAWEQNWHNTTEKKQSKFKDPILYLVVDSKTEVTQKYQFNIDFRARCRSELSYMRFKMCEKKQTIFFLPSLRWQWNRFWRWLYCSGSIGLELYSSLCGGAGPPWRGSWCGIPCTTRSAAVPYLLCASQLSGPTKSFILYMLYITLIPPPLTHLANPFLSRRQSSY